MVVKSFKNWKAPGSYGFTAEFYKSFWSVIKFDILEAVRHFFLTHHFAHRINHTIAKKAGHCLCLILDLLVFVWCFTSSYLNFGK